MIFTSFIIAVPVIYLQYFLLFFWEVLYFQSAQTNSAELFNSTSLKKNFVYAAVSPALMRAVV